MCEYDTFIFHKVPSETATKIFQIGLVKGIFLETLTDIFGNNLT